MARNGNPLWVALLTLASAVGTLGFACAAPFVALAAIAATRMSARAGFAMMGLVWAVNQAIGFGLLGYPHDPTTIAWGAGILSAALAAVIAARWGERAVTGGPALRVATAYGTGFVGFKATLLAWSVVLGGVHTALSPFWTARQFVMEAAILVGLIALYRALLAIGVPAARRATA